MNAMFLLQMMHVNAMGESCASFIYYTYLLYIGVSSVLRATFNVSPSRSDAE
jgi:hypothetical protein